MPDLLVSPLRVCAAQGHSHEDASDLTQEFFARFLEKRYLKSVDASLGKFRTFLLTSIKNFLANEWDKSQAQKRGGGQRVISFDDQTAEERYELEPVEQSTPETLFERRWAQTVIGLVLDRLAAETEAKRFEVLKPFLLEDKGVLSYEDGAAQFGMSVAAITSAIYRMRARADVATCVTKVIPALALTPNCDASIPYGTTTIHVSGTVTNIDPCATAQGVTLTNSDGTTLLGPIDLAGGAGTNYSATITVPVGCGPFTNTVTATGDGLAVAASATCVTTVTVYPTDITVCNDPGECGAFVTYPTGGCATPTCTPPSGSFFPLGTTTVACGPAAAPEGTFTVTVNACDNRCPLGPGFWKNNPSVWPVNSLTLGTITYTENQLLAILSTPIGTGKMDASLLLADELIAAKLDLLNGSTACPIGSTIAAADSLIFNLPIPLKISPSSSEGQQMIALAATLDNYNNGLLTPGCTP
jgi:RNA polymerase sigma-70 factor (ECF subfamily)